MSEYIFLICDGSTIEASGNDTLSALESIGVKDVKEFAKNVCATISPSERQLWSYNEKLFEWDYSGTD